MPRLPGGAAPNLPGCPRVGHNTHRVVKDGQYGSPPRQRYRCWAPDGTFHRFTPPLPREMIQPGVCDDCDNSVATHQGPVTGRFYALSLREVSAAFVAIGSGATYTRAADRARPASGRARLDHGRGGQLAAEWLDALAPAVLDGYAETEWSRTMVLDSTRFQDTNRRTGQQTLAFNVLAAYGYPPRGQGRPRLWALRCYHQARAQEWEDFLRQLDVSTPPKAVVTDGAPEIGNAVRAVWPELPGPSLPVPFVYGCEWHLRGRLLKVLRMDGVHGETAPQMVRLDTAFRRSEAWDEFVESTAALPATTRWLNRYNPAISHQVAVRHLLPWPHSTGALDTPLGRIRDFLDSRSFVLRNASRLNLTLGLMRLHLNGGDSERNYRRLMRAAITQADGRAPTQRSHYDAKGQPSLRV